jgi:DNA (cytosine-5)-methyltransferase 1
VSFDFVDLFSGIGGFHAALSAVGGNAVLASEIDPRPAAVYERNWGLRPEGDIALLAADAENRVPQHAVLAGGFPCQPFSKSGRQLGMSELRGRMVNEVLRILEVHKPPVVMLENVRNIAGPRQQEVWNAVVDGLREAGYRVPSAPAVFSPHLLPADRGGAPQIRERVYIVGTYVGRDRARRETDVEPIVTPRTTVDGWSPQSWNLEEHLLQPENTVQRRERYELNDDEREWIEVWNDFLRRTREITLPGFPMWSRYWADDQQVDPQAPEWKQVLERKNIEFYRENRVVIRQWLAANPRLRAFPASRQKLEWQAQNTPRDLRLCLLHLRPSGIRAKKPTYTPALVAMAQTPVMGPRMRRLTPLEAARLQGFPDWFDFGSQRDALTYKQLGNAVNVGTVYHVFVEHVRRDRDEIARHELGAALVDAVDRAPVMPLVPERGSAPSESIELDLDPVGR